MDFFIINGSPRKKCNTAKLLNKSIEGIKSIDQSAKISYINLYDLNFTGCKSCFACKLLDGKNYGRCSIKDDLKEILQDISNCDGLIIGSPIYLGNLTGETRSFLERLIFQYLTYDEFHTSLAPKKFPVSLIYSMNLTKEQAEDYDYPLIFSKMEGYIGEIFQKPSVLNVYNTYQFKDYSKYKMEIFNEKDKYKQRKEQFPKDLDDAFKLGVDLVNSALSDG